MKYSCFYCGSVYLEKIGCCTVCLGQNTIIPLPEKERTLFVRPNRGGRMSSKELRGKKLGGDFIEGFEDLGKLPRNFKMMVYGLPGSGKSTMALQVANNYKGRSLYFSCEEGFGEDFISKVVKWEIWNIEASDAATRMEIEEDLGTYNPDLVVIDSVSVLDKIPTFDCACIYICHSNKDGKYKGESMLAHFVQVIVRISNGTAHVEKNRFSKRSTFKVFG